MKMKEIELCIGGLLLLIVVFVGATHLIVPKKTPPPQVQSAVVASTTENVTQVPSLVAPRTANPATPQVTFGSTTVDVLLAITDAEKEKGLSNHAPLEPNQGMLFIFPFSCQNSFWMKDMRFPLDIIWLDEQCRIVHIEKNLSPKTYPKIYTPVEMSRYVLEVNSGFSQKNNLNMGNSCVLRNI